MLLLLERFDDAFDLPRERRRRMLRLAFFSALEGSERVDDAKLCIVQRCSDSSLNRRLALY